MRVPSSVCVCVYVCERAPHCVSLLGIMAMKPNRPLLPGSLRCTANVSPLHKRCGESISPALIPGPSPGKLAAPHSRMLYLRTGLKTSSLDVCLFQEIREGFFFLSFFSWKQNKVSGGIRPNILWPCFSMKTKADWAVIEIHTSLFFVPQERRSRRRAKYEIPHSVYQKQAGLFYVFNDKKQHTRAQRMPLCPSPTNPPQRSTLSFHPPLTPVLLFALTPPQSNGTCGDIMTWSFPTLSS